MIATWMLFAVITSALFGLAALAAARAASASRRPTRLIWFVALLAAALWPPSALATSYFRGPAADAGILTLPLTVVTQQSRVLASGAWMGRLEAPLEVALLVLWVVLTSICGARLLRALRTLRRQRASWRPAQVGGVSVTLSPDVGPAVVGLGRMEIVLPEWTLALDRALLAMVLRHEEEHRRARDPLLLFASALIVALIPWNPVLWFCARRLRLAIELDCDARVISAHGQSDRYGLLLLMMAQRGTAGRNDFAPALTNPTSNLERRILAMRRAIPRFARVQLLAFSALAAATVAVACSVDTPESVTASKSVAAPRRINDTTAFFEFQVESPARALEGNPAPVYPEALEKANVGGDVLVQFVLDVTGRPEISSFKVLKSTDPLFTAAVKSVLPQMRFEPARVGGHAVRQLVQMPFGFKTISSKATVNSGALTIPSVEHSAAQKPPR